MLFFILILCVFKFAFQKLHCIDDFLFVRLKIFEYHSKRRIDATHIIQIFFYDFVMIDFSVFKFYYSFFHWWFVDRRRFDDEKSYNFRHIRFRIDRRILDRNNQKIKFVRFRYIETQQINFLSKFFQFNFLF